MAAKKFLVPIDLGKLELQNAAIQNLGSAPGTPVEGQLYYDTSSDSLFVYGGASQPGGGGAAFFNYHPKALLGVTNTWTATQTFNATINGNGTISLTGTGASSVGGVLTAQAHVASGLTGATTATRYVGGTASGAPGSGTFSTGDFVITQGGDVYICTSGGSPGTWARVGAYLLSANNTWSGTNAFNNAITGNNTINLTGTGSSSVGGTFSATAFSASGLSGATQASRYVGATSSGAPASGTFVQGDFVIARDGAIWVCTVGGTPGTWVQIGAMGTVYYQSIKANNGAALTQRSVVNFINGTYTTATAVDNASQSDVKFDVSTAAPTADQTLNAGASAGSATTLSRSDHQHDIHHLAGDHSTFSLSTFAAPTADISWGTSYKITNLANPSNPQDAATKYYVDNIATGLDVKGSVRAASAANVTVTYNATGGTSARGQITAAPNTLDGVTLVNGDRILLKDQSTEAQNGIWSVTTVGTGANGTWDRATDFDADAEVTAGAFVFVEEGTTNADSGWVLTTNNPITIGGGSGTALSWAQFSGAGQITAGAGLTKTGNTLDVGASTGIVVNADNIAVNRTGTNNAHVPLLYTTATHSSATSIAITHNLGTQWVLAQVYEIATSAQVEVDVICTSTTVTTFVFAVAPTANTYRFVIYG